ncbi:ABC transporter ATP-binding protein [Lactobacillus sp. ESL0791]|uniref:ATP-binding cassette domain-containing protein n=1 Tax=Lactobacillus sp. ESL0791 TaxID=2983234 RepID=UPI0023F6DF85|nr:ABC transporter ATP-binding protein [Lactobacillus sp. ESL0791]MDF7638429.1 ABC transporter ATP-binding protein [Lactobacillus sp. ESL0791]
MTVKNFYRTNPFRFCLLIVLNVLNPALPLVNAGILILQTTAAQQRNLRNFLLASAASLVVLCLGYGLNSLTMYLSSKQEEEYMISLRQQLNQHLFYDRQNHTVSQAQNRLTNDLQQNQQSYLAAFFTMLNGAGELISVMILLAVIHWSLLLVIALMTAISLTLPKLTAKPMQKASMRISGSNKKYLDQVAKWLSGLDELERYLAGEKLFKVMHKSAHKVEEANVKQTGVMQSLSVVDGLVSQVFSLILFIMAGVLIVRHQILFGVISVLGSFRFYATMAINMMVGAYGQIKGAETLNQAIAKDAEPLAQQSVHDVQTPVALQTKDLTLKFPNGERLLFPDLEIKQGEKILLTGDSGVGKTTLFKILLGEIQPTTGQVLFTDKTGDVIKPDLSKVGYIPQDPVLFPATIADNMTMFNVKLQDRLAPLVAKVQFAGDVGKFNNGLNEEINLNKLNVSGGQRQKIVLVRALVHDSEIILIDEGTSAIDQAATMEILRQVTSTQAAVIFIAHNFNEDMRQLFDREIHLEKK